MEAWTIGLGPKGLLLKMMIPEKSLSLLSNTVYAKEVWQLFNLELIYAMLWNKLHVPLNAQSVRQISDKFLTGLAVERA